MYDDFPGWHTTREKLLCFLELDDDIAQQFVPQCQPAYWRGFIVQNRETGIVSLKMRFKRSDGKSWTEITPKEQNDQTAQVLRCKMEDIFRKWSHTDEPIRAHYPPNDDDGQTIIWLEMQGLMEVTEVKEIKTEP